MPEAIRNKIATYYGDYLYTEIDKYLQKYKNDGVPIDSKPVEAVSKAEVDWWGICKATYILLEYVFLYIYVYVV